MRSLFALSVMALVGCGGASPVDLGAADGGDGGAVVTTDVGAALTSQGYTVKNGSFEILDLSTCCLTSCSGNNPTSPYGAIFVPEGPGQTARNPNERMDGMADSFHLRADEAILYVGKTPPEAKYFGFTPYLMDRAGASKRAPIFASLSETLNVGVIATEGASPFESRTAIIASADATTTQAVRGALASSGFPASAINTLVFDPAVSRFGLDEPGDTFGVLFRLALVKDPAKKAAYLASPGGTVYRVTPKAMSSTPLPAPAARAKSADAAELALKPAVQKLSDAIALANPLYAADPVLVDAGLPDPAVCISQPRFCAGDNRDTTYPGTPVRVLFPTDDDFYVVFGVDHQVSGKTTYANFSVYALEHLVGITGVASDRYAGSAQKYLASDPDAPKLYAWKIARVCNGEPFCLEVPKGACPTGLDNGALGMITFRTYLEPATKTAPDPNTLVRDRVLHFKKK
jgi:hypothetical protein